MEVENVLSGLIYHYIPPMLGYNGLSSLHHFPDAGGGRVVNRGGEVAVVVTSLTRRWWGGWCGVVEDGESEDEGLRENSEVSMFACVCVHNYISTLNPKISTLFTTTTTTTHQPQPRQ